MSLVLYRECDGAVVLKSKVLLIAGAFPIQLLAGKPPYRFGRTIALRGLYSAFIPNCSGGSSSANASITPSSYR
jgi:hypothetical protein